MKRCLIGLLLMVSTGCMAGSYSCDSVRVNGQDERPVEAVFNVDVGDVVLIQEGASEVITNRHYSLEKTPDGFVLTKYNHDLLIDSPVTYRKVFRCEGV